MNSACWTARFFPSLLTAIIILLAGCTTLPPGSDFPRDVSSALSNPEETRLGKQFYIAARQHDGNSGFRIIPVGADGFLIRMQMINAAERTLDLQYFIFRGDETGRLLTDAVLRAADRGVRVRILIDDGETEAGDEQIAALEEHSAIQIRLFNPFAYRGNIQSLRALEFMFNASRLDYRMHNKLLAVDNAVALVGGRNIGDQYFQIDPDTQFADDDVFVAGPLSRKLSATFDEFWNSPLAIPMAALSKETSSQRLLRERRQAMREQHRPPPSDSIGYLNRVASGEPFGGILSGRLPLTWAPAQVIYDSPDKKRVESGAMVGRLMQRAVASEVATVDSELLMVTPYLIPGHEGMRLFGTLRKRGVNIRILTNSLESSSVLLAQAGYMAYRVPLLTSGVQLYEIRARPGNAKVNGQTAAMARLGNYSLHAKLFVFDRRRVFIGSMNFDQRSMHLNTEIGLVIDSPALAQQVVARFDAMTQPANAYAVMLPPPPYDNGNPNLVWHTEEDKKSVDYSVEPARNAWQRIKATFLSLLPLDREL
jgi:putative cardiolipin synthase